MQSVSLAYDDTGGGGLPVILLPGAGDVRSENRFLAADLATAGYRAVSADLPGHGESPLAPTYGVKETAEALLALVENLDSGPAALIGTSFAPAAAVWAAAARPDKVVAVVAISPHLQTDDSLRGRLRGLALWTLLRGPWAAPLWTRLYRSWYKSRAPADLAAEMGKIEEMLSDPARRRAVRKTLMADRKGIADKIEHYASPTLVVCGSADNHFSDPAAEAGRVASRLGGDVVMVEGAGHYPHAERPDLVGRAIVAFLDRTAG